VNVHDFSSEVGNELNSHLLVEWAIRDLEYMVEEQDVV
jgi:hypothetical protein